MVKKIKYKRLYILLTILILIPVTLIIWNTYVLLTYKHVQGKVVQQVRETCHSGNYNKNNIFKQLNCYKYIAEYTVNGETHRITSDASSGIRVPIGSGIDVLINPKNKYDVKINHFLGMWGLPFILLLIALAPLLVIYIARKINFYDFLMKYK